jgi:DHA2 family multidrug resistance protein-like MFS transporter
LWSLPSAIGFIVGSVTAPRYIHRFPPSLIMGGGMAVAAVGAVLLLGVRPTGDTSLYLIVAASLVMSIALSPVITLATELIVGSAPPEQAGAATGVSETSGELGGALGIAILGSIGTAVYRSELADSLPSGIDAAVADAARDTLGGAIAVAETLPAEIGAALVAAAQTAFVDSIHVVAIVSGVGAVITAILAALALRGVPARSEPAEGGDAAAAEVASATG